MPSLVVIIAWSARHGVKPTISMLLRAHSRQMLLTCAVQLFTLLHNGRISGARGRGPWVPGATASSHVSLTNDLELTLK